MFARIRALLAKFDCGEINEAELSHRLGQHPMSERIASCFFVG